LRLKPNRGNIQILCCLKGGKSDPEVIRQFGTRARQKDDLHAKVIWTSRGAIITSANASSNGLPEEEYTAAGLIEAGVFIDNGSELSNIRRWFDFLYQRARPIRSKDLDAADAARAKRMWSGSRPRSKKQPLLQALREGGKLEFVNQRIYFALWKEETTREQNTSVRRFMRANSDKIESTLQVPANAHKRLTWYMEWPNLPRTAMLIDCRVKGEKIGNISVLKTFDQETRWHTKVGRERQRVTFALQSGFKGFEYRLSKADKNAIRACSSALWKKADGDKSGRMISLLDAAPLLLRHVR
jgi:hypothetical protein